MDRTIEPGTEAGWRVIDAAVQSAHEVLGDRLLSAYAIGSLAHGGFTASVSDVDLALLTDTEAGLDTSDAVATIVTGVAGLPLGDRLSIFHVPWHRFADPPPEARFPPIDRYDLIRYGVLVDGNDLRAVHGVAPAAAEIRAHAVDSALRRITSEQLRADLRGLKDGGVSVHDATKLVLWPIRLQHVCDTGEATGNAAAVEHYIGLVDAGHRPLAADGLAWRDLSAIPDPSTTLRRIAGEIHDLHAEVFLRLSRRPDVPRREIAERAHQIATAERGGPVCP